MKREISLIQQSPRCIISITNNCIAVGAMYTIYLINLKTSEYYLTIKEHSSFIYSLLKSDKFDYLISASNDRTIKVFSMKNNFKLVHTFTEHKSSVISLTQSTINQDEIISSSSDKTIHIYNLKSLSLIKILQDDSQIFLSRTLSPNYIISNNYGHSLKVWSIDSSSVITLLKGHESFVFSFTINDRYIISVSQDKTMKLWEISDFNCKKTITFNSYLNYIEMINKDKCIITDNAGGITIYNTLSQQIETQIKTKESMSVFSSIVHQGIIYYIKVNGVFSVNYETKF